MMEVKAQLAVLLSFRFRAKMQQLNTFEGILPESQGQNTVNILLFRMVTALKLTKSQMLEVKAQLDLLLSFPPRNFKTKTVLQRSVECHRSNPFIHPKLLLVQIDGSTEYISSGTNRWLNRVYIMW